jgi:hypothetical protein
MTGCRVHAASLADWLERLQELLPPSIPAAAVAAVACGLLLIVLLVLRSLWRALFVRRPRAEDWERELDIDLDACPLPVRPPGDRCLTVYHLPARLRLVVVAPAGREGDVDATAVEKLLDLVVPGLGQVAVEDRPRIRVWPAQLSHQGFSAAFYRHLRKAAGRGEPSRWVLVAGKAQVGRQPVMLGLGLWADQPNTIDRVTLGEPHQWLDVLRLKEREG